MTRWTPVILLISNRTPSRTRSHSTGTRVFWFRFWILPEPLAPVRWTRVTEALGTRLVSLSCKILNLWYSREGDDVRARAVDFPAFLKYVFIFSEGKIFNPKRMPNFRETNVCIAYAYQRTICAFMRCLHVKKPRVSVSTGAMKANTWSIERNFDNHSRVLLFSRRPQIALTKVIDFGATRGSAHIGTRSRHLTQSNGAVVQTSSIGKLLIIRDLKI